VKVKCIAGCGVAGDKQGLGRTAMAVELYFFFLFSSFFFRSLCLSFLFYLFARAYLP
jgi:hypothetical protein